MYKIISSIICMIIGHKYKWLTYSGTPRADGVVKKYPICLKCLRCDNYPIYPLYDSSCGHRRIKPTEKGYIPFPKEGV